MVNTRRIFFGFLLFLGLFPQLAGAAEVQAKVDRDQLAAGGSLHLELRVQGRPDADPDLSPLDKDWEVLNRSQSSQIQIVNGDFSRSLLYSLTLMPRQEGHLSIPAICFGADCSAPVPVRVTAAEQSPSGAESAELLLETEATPDKLFTQEQLLFKVRLLHRVDLLQGSLSEPQASGVDAVVQKIGDDRSYETRRAGRLYQVIERTYAIFPQASGALRILPLRFDGEISRGASRFDPFGRQGDRVRKQTETLPIEVLPPPVDLGGRNWLPARALSLTDDWQGKTLQLTVGEPATRTLTLTAEGLQAAQLPELSPSIPAAFKSYPDQPNRKDEFATSGVNGALQQKIALVATQPGRYELPAIALDWWDVKARQWRQAKLAPVSIVVAPAIGGTAAAPPALPKESTQAPAAAPPPTPAMPPVSAQQATSAASSGFWPWLSLALGLGWLATLLLAWRQRHQSPRSAQPANSHESPQQREKAARHVLRQAARSNEPRATRQALAAWCQARWPDSGPAGIEILERSDSAFQEEIDRLNRVLYTLRGGEWDGAGLLAALQRWEQQNRAQTAGNRLPDLYPTPTRSGQANSRG